MSGSSWFRAFGKSPHPAATLTSPRTIPQARIALAARGNAGKDALLDALYASLLNLSLPSGTQFDIVDPRQMAEAIRKHRAARQLMRRGPNLTTLDFEEREYGMFRGADPLARYVIGNPVGQCFTAPDTNDVRRQMFSKVVDYMGTSDVLWFLIPCPPRDLNRDDDERFQFDQNLLRPYLRGAISHPKRQRPCSIALVLTKLDATFDSPDEARQGLTDDHVHELLAPLINVVRGASDQQVSHAAVFPVSPFGFGNSVRIEQGTTDVDDINGDSYELSEPSYRLREDASFGAFNVPGLMVWSMLGGLWHQEVTQQSSQLQDTAVALCEDLRALNAWYIPIKGELV